MVCGGEYGTGDDCWCECVVVCGVCRVVQVTCGDCVVVCGMCDVVVCGGFIVGCAWYVKFYVVYIAASFKVISG